VWIALCGTAHATDRRALYDQVMSEQSKLAHEPAPSGQSTGESATGYGRQTRGSRKGLGGDPPNAGTRRAHPERTVDRATRAQIGDMESEGGVVPQD
jgi:hypothetical protein